MPVKPRLSAKRKLLLKQRDEQRKVKPQEVKKVAAKKPVVVEEKPVKKVSKIPVKVKEELKTPAKQPVKVKKDEIVERPKPSDKPAKKGVKGQIKVVGIVGNGEPGINRMCLEVAQKRNIKTGGVCMKDFNVVDKGPYPALKKYNLKPVASNWAAVLRYNTKMADATVLFYTNLPKHSFVGSIAGEYGKAHAIVVTKTTEEFLQSAKLAVLQIKSMLDKNEIILHVVGSVMPKPENNDLVKIAKLVNKFIDLLQE